MDIFFSIHLAFTPILSWRIVQELHSFSPPFFTSCTHESHSTSFLENQWFLLIWHRFSLPYFFSGRPLLYLYPLCGLFAFFLVSFSGEMAVTVASASFSLQLKAIEKCRAFESSTSRLALAAGFGPFKSSTVSFGPGRYANNCCSLSWFLEAPIYYGIVELLLSHQWIIFSYLRNSFELN